MKVAFTGKGGVGKTTLASLFVQTLAKGGQEVLAVDCDPDSNLARMLGFADAEKIIPISQMKEMIEQRMGVQEGDRSFFQLNPKIDDIPEKFSRSQGNIKLIVMGTVDEAGSGCMCPESTFVKNLLRHLVLKTGEHLVMDMEAGVEHFGRGTAGSCDFVLIVVEPSLNSIQTADRIANFARDLGINKVFAIGNKARSKEDSEFMSKQLGKIKLVQAIEFNPAFLDRDKKKDCKIDNSKISAQLNTLKQFLEGELN